MSQAGDDARIRALTRRHLRFGWWSLLAFLTLGVVLEALHGFKVGFYVDVANATRRHLWTLAHAHGTLLSLVHVVFGLSLGALPGWAGSSQELASRCLLGATVLVPGGFFLGGAVFYGGDPGLGIFLLPVGALLLFGAVLLTARATGAR